MSTQKRELTKRHRWGMRLDLELTLVSHIGWCDARHKHRSLEVIENETLAPLDAL